jgi:hypothetical protein
MPVSYPKSSAVVADTDATAAQYNNLRSDAVESRIVTLVAGENLTALDAVYEKAADGKAYKAKSSATAAETVFFGFATTSVSAAASVNVICFGYMDGFTGLTTGSKYYLDSTYGAISTTQPSTTATAMVGIAVSTTVLLVMPDLQRLIYAATFPDLFTAGIVGGDYNNGHVQGAYAGTLTIGAVANTSPTTASISLHVRSQLYSASSNYGALFLNHIINSSTNYTDIGSNPFIPSGKTVTNRYFLSADNDIGPGYVTNSYFASIGSNFLTGGTTSTTHVNDLKVSTASGLRYIRLYT